jgi:hypothetical protein
MQAATASTPAAEAGSAKPVVGSVEVLDECFSMDVCIDRYLWALYQRTLKEDTIKVEDRKKVTVKRKGKTITVTKTFTTVVNEDFAWKDPKAADKANMSMMDYVIGGMDPTFKLKLFHALLAAEQAGLSPGITSAFRDDYDARAAMGFQRNLLEMDRRARQGVRNRAALSRSGSTARGAGRRQGICRSQRRHESPAGWIRCEEAQAHRGAGRPQRN